MRISKRVLFSCLLLVVTYVILWNYWNSSSIKDKRDQPKRLRKFYIYEWPNDIVNRWPLNYNHHRLSIEKHFELNHGAGEVLDSKIALYHTHQYSLFKLFYENLLISPYRTKNPDEASLFFVPYDIGMDSSTDYENGALRATNCPKKDNVQQLLSQSKYFQRSKGYDHFFLVSINQMMLHFLNEPCQQFLQFCMNCTKLGIDTYTEVTYPNIKTLNHLTNNWISIPFPSDYHLSLNFFQNPPWKRIISDKNYFPTIYEQERPFTISFMGTDQVTAKLQKSLRQEIIQTCQLRPSICLLSILPSHFSTVNRFDDVKSIALNYPYLKSKFCLAPGGDFPTRKGYIDSMLSGCIPVVFDWFAAHSQWHLHWLPEIKAYETSIHIPRERAMANMSAIFDELVQVSQDYTFIKAKLEAIAKVGNRFQYPIPSKLSKYLRSFNQLAPENPEDKDAISVTIDTLFDHQISVDGKTFYIPISKA